MNYEKFFKIPIDILVEFLRNSCSVPNMLLIYWHGDTQNFLVFLHGEEGKQGLRKCRRNCIHGRLEMCGSNGLKKVWIQHCRTWSRRYTHNVHDLSFSHPGPTIRPSELLCIEMALFSMCSATSQVFHVLSASSYRRVI